MVRLQLSSEHAVHYMKNDNYTSCGIEIDGQFEETHRMLDCGRCIRSKSKDKKLPKNEFDGNHRCYTCGRGNFTEQGLWRHKTFSDEHIRLQEGDLRQTALIDFI